MILSILGIALVCIAIGLNIGKLLYSRHEEAKRKNQEPIEINVTCDIPAEINVEDLVPGAVIEPKDIPERDLTDFDI